MQGRDARKYRGSRLPMTLWILCADFLQKKLLRGRELNDARHKLNGRADLTRDDIWDAQQPSPESQIAASDHCLYAMHLMLDFPSHTMMIENPISCLCATDFCASVLCGPMSSAL